MPKRLNAGVAISRREAGRRGALARLEHIGDGHTIVTRRPNGNPNTPHYVLGAALAPNKPASSWWVGLTREEFMARAAIEQQRLQQRPATSTDADMWKRRDDWPVSRQVSSDEVSW